MIARLQRDVCGGAVRGVPFLFCVMNGHLFSVEATEVVVPTLCDDRAVLDENAPHQRVGPLCRVRSATKRACSMNMRSPRSSHRSHAPTRHLFKIACMKATSFCVRRPSIYSFCID